MTRANRQRLERLDATWRNVRRRLAQFPEHFYPEKTVELVDLCRESTKIKNLVPYVSLGRLCLSSNKLGKPYTDDCPCMYYYDNHFTASSYDNTLKFFFDSATEAVQFVEKNIPLLMNEE
jgi:hypothetical protein